MAAAFISALVNGCSSPSGFEVEVADLFMTSLFKAESKTPPHDVILFSGQFSTTACINWTAKVFSLALVLPPVPKSRSKITWIEAGKQREASLDLTR